jgi:ATP-binding cassette subfamily B protein
VTSELALYRRLLRIARPYWIHFTGLLGLGLVAGPIKLLSPLPLKIVVDSVLGDRPLPPLLHVVVPPTGARPAVVLLLATGLLVVVTLLGQLLGLASNLLRSYVGERLVLDLRARLIDQVHRLSLSYHDSRGTGDSIYRIQQDAPAIQSIMVDGAVPFVSAAIMLAMMFAVIARLDRQLALVALAVSPPLFLLSRFYRPRMRRRSRSVKKLESSALAGVQETLGALRVVKAFGQEARERDRLLHRLSEGVTARIRLALLEGGYGLVIGLVTSLGLAAVLLIGVGHVRAGVLTLGQLLMVLSYLGQLYDPLKTMSRKVAGLQSYLASAERVFGLLDERPDVPERPDARPLGRAAGSVAFRGVSFSYGPARPVLHDVSFAVQPGTRLGIVGTSGAGKTTLISLLTRFYDPTDGEIALDGVDLRDYKLEDLRRQFAVVPQDPVLFSTSIAENIAYARPAASREEIIAAAQAANAHEFIVRLPQGYDTQAGERGVQLSGGQRQRIAIARAFLKDSPVLILDEPTSAVDAEAEAAILGAIRRLMRGRTVILISHRGSLLEGCTALLVLEHGRVVTDAAPPPAGASPSAAAAANGRRSNLRNHPAVHAWCELHPDLEPVGITPLRVGRLRKAYRLEGAARAGAAVVAKRCRRASALIERTVYEEILPRLAIPSLHYYGFLDEPDTDFSWLFMEAAPGIEYSQVLAAHRAQAGHWLGLLHTAAADASPKGRLPDGGPGRYREFLRSTAETIPRHFDNPMLGSDDVGFLEGLLARLAEVDAHWQRLEALCVGLRPTLVHGDFNGKNLRLRPAGAGTTVVVFDWADAGWGVPAVDLAQTLPSSKLSANPDIATYWSTVRESSPDVSSASLRQLANCGTVFRALAALSWAVKGVGHEWASSTMAHMRIYEAELARALDLIDRTPQDQAPRRAGRADDPPRQRRREVAGG